MDIWKLSPVLWSIVQAEFIGLPTLGPSLALLWGWKPCISMFSICFQIHFPIWMYCNPSPKWTNSVLLFSKFLSSLLWFSLAKTNTSSTLLPVEGEINFKKSHIKGWIPFTDIMFLLSQLGWQWQNTFVHYLPRHVHCRISKKFDRKSLKKVTITDFLFVTNVMASTISRWNVQDIPS